MVDVGVLADLQEIDLTLDAAKQRLGEIEARLAAPPLLPAIESEIAAQRALEDAAATDRKSAEDQIAAITAKIEAEDGKLYGGTVTDPRELRHLQEEIYALRRQLKGHEDRALSDTEREDTEAKAVEYLQTLASALSTAWTAVQSDLQTEREKRAGEAAVIEAEVQEHRQEIPADELAVYDMQRRTTPLAVVKVSGGVCAGCHLSLPMNVITRARRRTELVRCPACQRIIYVA